jgi:hypothetical protein
MYNSKALSKQTKTREKLEVLGRRIKKADDVVRLLDDTPSARLLRKNLLQAQQLCDQLWLLG